MKIIRKKRVIIIIAFVGALFLLLIFNLVKDKSYEEEYSIKSFNITENYNKKLKLYTFKISTKENSFSFLENIKYVKKHKIINDIEEITLDNEFCLIIKSNYFTYNPLCMKDELEVDYRLVSKEMQEKLDYKKENDEEEKTYDNLKVNNLLDYNYLVWNYKGFNKITKNGIETIDLFANDIYEIPLSKMVNNYLLIADYDSKYNFNKFYIINVLKGTKEEFKIKDDISFDSYILGSYKESIYLVDKKNKIEYEIVPHKKKIRKVGTENRQGVIYTEKGLEKISLTKLISKEYKFYDDNLYSYKIVDDRLVQELNDDTLLISDNKVKDILAIRDDTVLYLVDDTIFLYNTLNGEKKIMQNFEWNFNYKNSIYFYQDK